MRAAGLSLLLGLAGTAAAPRRRLQSEEGCAETEDGRCVCSDREGNTFDTSKLGPRPAGGFFTFGPALLPWVEYKLVRLLRGGAAARELLPPVRRLRPQLAHACLPNGRGPQPRPPARLQLRVLLRRGPVGGQRAEDRAGARPHAGAFRGRGDEMGVRTPKLSRARIFDSGTHTQLRCPAA